jgi:hypothetical protein
VQSYLEGLYWVLIYYHKGCGSWTWYYPYLYAPLASDLVNLASIEVKFEAGRPFTPLLQLLSVLPPQSGEGGMCHCGCAYMRVLHVRALCVMQQASVVVICSILRAISTIYYSY